MSENDLLQGTGHFAQAYADMVLRNDFPSAYQEVILGLAAIRTHPAVKKALADVDAQVKARAETPPGSPS